MKRDFPAFYIVRAEHGEIHDSLLNWARLVKVQSRIRLDDPSLWLRGSKPMPIFAHYRASADSMDFKTREWEERETKPPPIKIAAGWKMEKAVSELPPKNRDAVRWFYVFPGKPPGMVARKLGLTIMGLQEHVHNGRSMLKNRGN